MLKAKIEPLRDHISTEFLLMWVIANSLGLLAGLWLGRQITEILWPSPTNATQYFHQRAHHKPNTESNHFWCHGRNPDGHSPIDCISPI